MKKKLRAFTILTALSAVTIHAINKCIYYLSTIDNLLHKDTGNYYEWRFGKIHYEKSGTGKPLLLIHDLSPESCSFEWSHTIDTLSKNHTVYAIDLLGCGASDKPILTYTNFLYVQMITDFIKNVIKEPADLIATGSSAPLAVMTCVADKDIIDKMLFVNPDSLGEQAKIPTKRTRLLRCFINMPLIGTLLYNILFSKKSLSFHFESEYYYDVSKLDERVLKTYHEASHSDKLHSRYLFASIKGHYTKVNLCPFLPEFTHSIFILNGAGNPLYYEHAKQYQKLLPSIEIIPIQHTKFLPQLEAPKDFCEQVEILLDPK